MLKKLIPIMLLALATACAHVDGSSCCSKDPCCCKEMTKDGKKACKAKLGSEKADKGKDGSSGCCCCDSNGDKSAKKACKGKMGK